MSDSDVNPELEGIRTAIRRLKRKIAIWMIAIIVLWWAGLATFYWQLSNTMESTTQRPSHED
jgi:hypothetical protein